MLYKFLNLKSQKNEFAVAHHLESVAKRIQNEHKAGKAQSKFLAGFAHKAKIILENIFVWSVSMQKSASLVCGMATLVCYIHVVKAAESEPRLFFPQPPPQVVPVVDEAGEASQLQNTANSLSSTSDIYNWIIEEGTASKAISDRYGQLLLDFSKNNNTEALRMLLDLDFTNKSRVNVESSYNKYTALHYAVSSKNLWLVQRLIENGININALNADHETALVIAARLDWLEGVQALLGTGKVRMNRVDLLGNTALHYAVLNKNLEMLQVLVEYEIHVNAVNKQHETAFLLTARLNWLEGMQRLLDTAVKIRSKTVDAQGNNPLHHAVRARNAGMINLLIELELDINAVNKRKETPLILAAKLDWEEGVQLLLDPKADKVMQLLDEQQGQKALPASQNSIVLNTVRPVRQFEDVQTLIRGRTDLDQKAKTTFVDIDGNTALDYAVINRNAANVEKLIHNKAPLNHINAEVFETPLSLAISRGFPEITEILLSAGASVLPLRMGSDRVSYLIPALLGAAVYQKFNSLPGNMPQPNPNMEIISQLISAGVELNHVSRISDEGDKGVFVTPYGSLFNLSDPVQEDILVAVGRILLPAGADANLRRNFVTGDDTMLHWAIDMGYSDLALLLLEHGAKPDIKRRLDKAFPLELAVIMNLPEVVQKLIEKGVSVNQVGGAIELTPLQLAVRNFSVESIDILLENNADVRTTVEGEPVLVSLFARYDFDKKDQVLEIFNKLVDAGAEVDVVNKGYKGSSVPLLAALGNHPAILRRLRDLGVDIRVVLPDWKRKQLSSEVKAVLEEPLSKCSRSVGSL